MLPVLHVALVFFNNWVEIDTMDSVLQVIWSIDCRRVRIDGWSGIGLTGCVRVGWAGVASAGNIVG